MRIRQKNKTPVRSAYADLGLSDAEGMVVKARLVSEIADLIRRQGPSLTEAAKLFEMPQPKLSNILRGRFRGVSERRLMDCLTRLGCDVQIVVKPASKSRPLDRVTLALV